jgi:hypothetical protein
MMPDFACLTRRELQKLAKEAGIKANLKSSELVALLTTHYAEQEVW